MKTIGKWIPVLLASIACACSTGNSPLEIRANLYAWTQLGPQGLFARALTLDAACPSITIDGTPMQMVRRHGTKPPGFEEIEVCDMPIPDGTESVMLDGVPLPLAPAQPTRIAILGDTGCRISEYQAQDCNRDAPGGWRFPTLARSIAATEPDLIIHLGDYHYREAPCPDATPGCALSPYGPNWESWKADFFAPAHDLLPKAPWIFLRGNHEDCNRGWRGWFFALAPGPLPQNPWNPDNCQTHTSWYPVALGDWSAALLDSATAPHAFTPPADPLTVAAYAAQLEEIADAAGAASDTWLMTHRPFWAAAAFEVSGNPQLAGGDITLQASLAATDREAFPPGISALFAGHIHTFERILFPDGRPPQFVIGNSGTSSDPPITPELIAAYPEVFAELGTSPQNLMTRNSVAFALLEPSSGGWTLSLRDVEGAEIDTVAVP